MVYYLVGGPTMFTMRSKAYIAFAVFIVYAMRAILLNGGFEQAGKPLGRSSLSLVQGESSCADDISVLLAIVSSDGASHVFGRPPKDWHQIVLTSETLSPSSRSFLSSREKEKAAVFREDERVLLGTATPQGGALAREWALLSWLDRTCPEAKFVIRVDDNENNALININVLNATLEYYSKLAKNEENFWVVKGPLQIYSRSTIRHLLPRRRHNSRQISNPSTFDATRDDETESLLAPESAEFVALGRGLCNTAFETDREKHSQTLASWKLCEQTDNAQDNVLSLLDLVKLGTGGSYRWGEAYQAGGAKPSWGRDTVYASFSNISWPSAPFQFSVSGPHLCDADVRTLVVILSAPSHRKERDFLRIHNRPPKGWRRVFLLGSPVSIVKDDPEMVRCWEGAVCPVDLRLARKVEEESRKFGDVVIGNFIDTYQTLTLKTVAMLDWALIKCPNAKMLFKVDDDWFPNYVVLDDTVQSYENNQQLVQRWVGTVTTSEAFRDEEDSKTIVSFDEFPGTVYPHYMSGACYGMSMDMVEVFRHMARRVQFMPIEDAFIGLVAFFSGIRPEKFAPVVRNPNCSKALWEFKEEFQKASANCLRQNSASGRV